MCDVFGVLAGLASVAHAFFMTQGNVKRLWPRPRNMYGLVPYMPVLPGTTSVP